MLAGGLTDMIGGRSARKKQEAMFRRILGEYRALGSQLDVAGAQALQERRRGLRDIAGGFTGALAEIAGGERASVTAANDVATRDFGYAQQQALNAGQYDMQALTTARRGISSDLSRTIAQISQATAQQRAGLLGQQGLAMASGRGGIADQYMQNFGARAGITQGLTGAMGNVQFTSGSSGMAFGMLGSALDDILAKKSAPKTDFAGNPVASVGSKVQ
jgi:hypothetical protein